MSPAFEAIEVWAGVIGVGFTLIVPHPDIVFRVIKAANSKILAIGPAGMGPGALFSVVLSVLGFCSVPGNTGSAVDSSIFVMGVEDALNECWVGGG